MNQPPVFVIAVFATLVSASAAAAGPESFSPATGLPAGAAGGACCTIDACLPAADEAECTALNGVFLPGEDCAADPCGEGACCFETACSTTDAFSCVTAGRIFAGAGTSCLDDPCEAGVGACCLGADACDDLSPDDCDLAGGTWLGAGTFCSTDPCLSGSCCLPDDCQETIQLDCMQLGGTLIAGTSCIDDPCSPPDLCPEGTLFSQNPDDPDDFIALTSEDDPGLRRFEDFSGVGGAIDALTWWGLDLDFLGADFVECVEADTTFEITFHEDAGGVPGAAVCSYTLLASRTPQGIFYLGAELNLYEVTLPTPCVLVNGWVSIVGLGDAECWFLWMSAGSGSSYCDGCLVEEEGFDLALCLQGTEGGVFGACCDDVAATCTDGVEITDCTAAGLRFAPDQDCADLDPPCGVILGACCFADATCTIEQQADCDTAGGAWLGADTLCDQCPCITPCPAGGLVEGEPVCFDGYVDEFNGGCTALVEAFSPIALGDTVCGEAGVYDDGDGVDFDWFEFTLTRSLELEWTAVAEFPPAVFILDGNGGCPGIQLAGVAALECEPVTATATLGPGTHWVVIRSNGFTDTSFCGARYTATLKAVCVGDLDGNGTVATPDLLILLSQWGKCASVCSADFDGSGDVATPDLLLMLAAWGPCVK